jgi:uronate dehydrogenase
MLFLGDGRHMDHAAPEAARPFQRLLLTGATGEIGTGIRQSLRGLCRHLRLLDTRPVEAVEAGEEMVIADLADARSVDAFEGVDAVVHMATLGSKNNFRDLVENNIVGTYNLFEACRRHAIRRTVYGSANHVIGFYTTDETIDEKAMFRPDGVYGATKLFGEGLAQYYFDRWGIETVSIRVGSCFARPRDHRMLRTWISHGDMGRLVAASLTAPKVGHLIVYGVSDNRDRVWRDRSFDVLGYRPQDSADAFRVEIESTVKPVPADDVRARHHGGSECGKPVFGEPG